MPHVELPQAEFKVVMLGDTQVGKTSLVMRFVEGGYRENRSATVGAFFIMKRLQIAGITCKVQIWDTAGQAQFRPLAKMYYSHSAAAILCYDPSDYNSWQAVKFWLEELHRNVPAGNIVLCLCACKIDSGPMVVSKEEAVELANSNGAMHVETSSKTNHHVINVFERVAERVLQFQKSERETGLGNIPVTPGAAVDPDGNVVKAQFVTTPGASPADNVNGYGINEAEREGDLRGSNRKPHRNSPEEEKKEAMPDPLHSSDDKRSLKYNHRRSVIGGNSEFSSQQPNDKSDSHRFGMRVETSKEIAPESRMCGIVPTHVHVDNDCTIL